MNSEQQMLRGLFLSKTQIKELKIFLPESLKGILQLQILSLKKILQALK